MRPLTLRRLTTGERALAAEMFGAALETRRVRILALPVLRRAFVAGPGLVVWPARSVPADFAEASVHTQAVFVHELTHVWQAQHGVRLLLAKIKAGDSDASYAYDLTGERGFPQMNIEQQAMVVEHAFLAARGVAAQHPPEVYAAAQGHWRQA
jgi:hypothetical protein